MASDNEGFLTVLFSRDLSEEEKMKIFSLMADMHISKWNKSILKV